MWRLLRRFQQLPTTILVALWMVVRWWVHREARPTTLAGRGRKQCRR